MNTGPAINTFLREAKEFNKNSEAMHLLFSANRWFLAKEMLENLAAGTNIVADRYSFSGIAYSLAKGLDKTWVCMPEIGLPKPDVVLFLDAEPTITAMRDGFGDEAFEQSDFQNSVYWHMKEIFNDAFWQVQTFVYSLY